MARRSPVVADAPATPNGHQVVTAAAQRIGRDPRTPLPLEVNAPGRARRAQAWQEECWGYADSIGEVGYGIGQMAGAMAKARLFIGHRPSPKDHPVEAVDEGIPGAEVAAEMLDRLENSPQGLSGLLYESAYNFQVTGEFYVVGEGTGVTDVAETWDVRSVDEVTTAPGRDADGRPIDKVSVVDEPGQQPRPLSPDDSFVTRIWRRHPRYGGTATSPMRAIRTEFDELLILSRAIRSVARSRIGAGILLLPSGLKVVPLDPVSDATPGQGTGAALTLGQELLEAMITPIADEGAASAVVPLVIEGDKDMIAAATHLKFDRPIDPVMAAQRQELLLRINQGMNWPVEIGMGIGKANDWSAFAITQSMFDSHVQPELMLICQGFWTGVVRPLMVETLVMRGTAEMQAKAWADAMFIGVDPTNLISKPSVTSDILAAANGRFPYVNAAFVRKELGAGDDDACNEAELAQIAAFAAASARKPSVTLPGEDVGAMPAPEAPGATPEAKVTGGPAPAPSSATASAITAAASPRNAKRAKLGAKLGAIDRALFIRLEAAASAALTRALERAGNRVRSRAQRNEATRSAVASGVPAADVAATLGPSMVASLGFDDPDLLDGSFDDLAAKFDTWTARAQAQARAAIADATGGDGSLDDIAIEQNNRRSEAVAFLIPALAALAAQRLYDPHPAAPPLGEHDSTMTVPPGLIREALSRAGGAGGSVDANGPTGGVATGQDIRDYLNNNGTPQTGWEWSYGDSEREFPAHVDLDGVTFGSWEDDVLAVQAGDEWVDGGVPGFYAPGDHPFCRCLASPLYDEGTGGADVSESEAAA